MQNENTAKGGHTWPCCFETSEGGGCRVLWGTGGRYGQYRETVGLTNGICWPYLGHTFLGVFYMVGRRRGNRWPYLGHTSGRCGQATGYLTGYRVGGRYGRVYPCTSL